MSAQSPSDVAKDDVPGASGALALMAARTFSGGMNLSWQPGQRIALPGVGALRKRNGA